MIRHFVIFLLLISARAVVCQDRADFVCELYKLDLSRGSTEESIDRKPFQKFGEYKNYGSMEEERINKFFSVPNTRWYAVISMFTSDESLPRRGSVNWELSFSKTRRRKILASPAYASSESTFNAFDVGRVSTFVKLGKRRMMITLQCEAPQYRQKHPDEVL